MGNSTTNPVLSATLEELSQLFEDHFRGRSYFAFVYGSYAYGTQRPDSDMDIIVAVEQKSQEDVDFVVSSVLDVHNRFNMGIDNEIPHSKKLLIDYSFLEAAVKGAGFRRFDNSIWIPPIVKTPEYLQSDELLLRFFLDSMVHKHVLIGGDVSKYEMFRANGVGTLTAIVAYMNQLEETDLSKLTEGFLKYDNRTGDFLFGFEDFPYYRKYLEEVLKEAIGSLEPYVMESVDWPHLTFDRLGLERYLAGALYRELEDRTRELDFAVNTNAFGSLQGVLANLDMSLGVLETYLILSYEKTRNAIAKMCNVPSATVGLGVGATELLFAVPRVFPVNSYVAMRPSFWEYEEAFRRSGSVKLVPIQLDEQHGFQIDIGALEVATKSAELVVICNPNNPTSTLIESRELLDLVESYPSKTFVIDETYLLFRDDYSQLSLSSFVEGNPNLLVISSLSKIFALPGLRAGFIVAHPSILKKFEDALIPYGIGPLGEKAIQLASNDQAFLARVLDSYRVEREHIMELIGDAHLPIVPIEPEGNFVFAKVKNGHKSSELVGELGEKGFLVRDCSPFPGSNGEWVRFAIKSRRENILLINAVREIGDGRAKPLELGREL